MYAKNVREGKGSKKLIEKYPNFLRISMDWYDFSQRLTAFKIHFTLIFTSK